MHHSHHQHHPHHDFFRHPSRASAYRSRSDRSVRSPRSQSTLSLEGSFPAMTMTTTRTTTTTTQLDVPETSCSHSQVSFARFVHGQNVGTLVATVSLLQRLDSPRPAPHSQSRSDISFRHYCHWKDAFSVHNRRGADPHQSLVHYSLLRRGLFRPLFRHTPVRAHHETRSRESRT
jgi:hypothetical protein